MIRRYAGIATSSVPELPSNDTSITVTTTQADVEGADFGMWCGNIMIDRVWQKLICTYSSRTLEMALENNYEIGDHEQLFVRGGREDGSQFDIVNDDRLSIDAIEIFAQAKTA